MARTRENSSIEPTAPKSEARERKLRLRELSDADVVQASLDGDDRAFDELMSG